MLDTLRRIIQDINAARDLNEALSVIVADVKAALHTDVCSVYMTDHLRSEYVLMATDGLRPGAVGKVRLKLGQGLIGLAASRAEPINVENAPAHPAFRYVPATGEAPFHGLSRPGRRASGCAFQADHARAKCAPQAHTALA